MNLVPRIPDWESSGTLSLLKSLDATNDRDVHTISDKQVERKEKVTMIIPQESVATSLQKREDML